MYLGLDVSTKTVGICVIDENGELLTLKHCNPYWDKKNTPKKYKLFDKKANFIKFMKEEVLSKYDIKHVFIEEPLMRSNNQFTVITLAQFNVLVSEAMYELGYDVHHISERDARMNFFPEYCKVKMVKGKEKVVFSRIKDVKEVVLNKVKEMEPDIQLLYNSKGNPMKENYDMVDAYVVCKAGIDIIMPELMTEDE